MSGMIRGGRRLILTREPTISRLSPLLWQYLVAPSVFVDYENLSAPFGCSQNDSFHTECGTDSLANVFGTVFIQAQRMNDVPKILLRGRRDYEGEFLVPLFCFVHRHQFTLHPRPTSVVAECSGDAFASSPPQTFGLWHASGTSRAG